MTILKLGPLGKVRDRGLCLAGHSGGQQSASGRRKNKHVWGFSVLQPNQGFLFSDQEAASLGCGNSSLSGQLVDRKATCSTH